METVYQILGVVAAMAVMFVLYQTIKNRPELFKREHLSKSFTVMGILALLLMLLIALLVWMLRM